MSTKKTQFKIELILFFCFVLLFARAVSVTRGEAAEPVENRAQSSSVGEKDEQGEGILLVEYATGSDAILDREVVTMQIPTPTPPSVVTPTATPEPTPTAAPVEAIRVADLIGTKYVLEDLQQLEYLKNNFYIVNATTKMTESEFDVEYFISRDLSVEKSEEPQILIFHTHGSEGFADSRSGMTEDSIIGVGELLADILREKYGYNVLHDTTIFDKKDGKDNRNYAYSEALPHVEDLLEQYPSIEVIIDLHRDAGTKRVATINGKQTAKVMLFNGLCRNTQGKLTYLPNENLADNLAFSFQLKLIGDEMYPGLMNRIFLKDYRYNMHLLERYLLIELGTEQNTVEEAKNAMEPLADVLAQVLGDN